MSDAGLCPCDGSCKVFPYKCPVVIPRAQYEALMAGLKNIAAGRADNGRALGAETARQLARGMLIEIGITWNLRDNGVQGEKHEAPMAQQEALKIAHRVLIELVKPNEKKAALHVFALAVEAEMKVRKALRAAGIQIEESKT